MRRAVIVDDDRPTRRVLQILLQKLELDALAFERADAALEHLAGESCDLVLTDLRMPEIGGLEFMRALREIDPEVPVIVLTAFGTVESAVEAMKLGAVDFVSKPFDVDALELLIRRALEARARRDENRYLREHSQRTPAVGELVGRTPAMERVFELVRRAAPTRSAILITGETGSGKELVARALHGLSPRSDRLFVPLNCSAIPGELLESELFGHAKGAFSGALAERVGKFQAADGGTLFLDEIGDMEPRLQAKLLRVLQESVIEPVGSNRRIPVDVRIVSSTHRDLERAMDEGLFREDLFFRLNVIRIELPPLRDRREDIPELAAGFLRSFGSEMGKGELVLGEGASRLLQEASWRGNVRELRNLCERAAVLARGRVLDAAEFRALLPATESPSDPDDGEGLDLAAAVAAEERRVILRALARTGDNKAAAAGLLGIGERTLWTKLKRHGL